MNHQGCEPKTECRFLRSVFVGFPRPQTRFYESVFRLPKKIETEKPTRFFLVGFVLQSTATTNRPTLSAKKTKNRPSHYCFRVNFGSQLPWSPHDTNTCTLDPLKSCLFSWFHRETDREMFGFGFGFSFENDRNRSTIISVKNRKTDRGHFHFRCTTLNPVNQCPRVLTAYNIPVCVPV